MDFGGIKARERFDEKIQIAIDQCDVFLMLLTPASVRSGGFCRQELTYALQNGKWIIPFMVLDCSPPIQITTYNWLDFRHDYSNTFAILINALQRNDLEITSLNTEEDVSVLNNYRIEGSNVIVFYQQQYLSAIARRIPPRIAGHGGYLFGRAAVFEECIMVPENWTGK